MSEWRRWRETVAQQTRLREWRRDGSLDAAATAAGYEIERITLEGQGLCSACRPPRPGAARDPALQTEPEAAAGSGPASTEPRP